VCLCVCVCLCVRVCACVCGTGAYGNFVRIYGNPRRTICRKPMRSYINPHNRQLSDEHCIKKPTTRLDVRHMYPDGRLLANAVH